MIFPAVHLAGCVTAHQNFIDTMNFNIGKNIDELEPHEYGAKHKIIGTLVLPNGNIEYQYNAKTTQIECKYVYEVNPINRRILSWRINGDDKGCILPP